MKILIEIQDESSSFAMKVLKSLTFVKKASPVSESSFDLWRDLSEASEDVRLHKEGKLKLKTARTLLNEL